MSKKYSINGCVTWWNHLQSTAQLPQFCILNSPVFIFLPQIAFIQPIFLMVKSSPSILSQMYSKSKWKSSQNSKHYLHQPHLFKVCFDGIGSLREDNIWWHNPFDEWQNLMKYIRVKTVFKIRQLLLEDSLWWLTILNGRQLPTKDDHHWTTPSREDDLWWKTTFNARRPLEGEHGASKQEVSQPPFHSITQQNSY